eukprot:1141244-Pelagomonas_calceolata.AAC.2
MLAILPLKIWCKADIPLGAAAGQLVEQTDAHSAIHSRTHARCQRQPQLTSPTQKVNPVSCREAQASCTRRKYQTLPALLKTGFLNTKYQANLKGYNLTDTGVSSWPRRQPLLQYCLAGSGRGKTEYT